METSADTLPSPLCRPVTDLRRWLLALAMLLILALGWHWPWLGFGVPLVMAAGIGGAFWRGRYVCGNLCPRGSFYDTLYRPIGGTRPIPALLRALPFRWAAFAALMLLMVSQILRAPHDPLHWGRVFWAMCLATTVVGVVLGFFYRARTWCACCPVGTAAAAIGGERYRLQLAPSCRQCGHCEASCPLGLGIRPFHAAGTLPHRDCLKCSSCVAACPEGSLAWPRPAKPT